MQEDEASIKLNGVRASSGRRIIDIKHPPKEPIKVITEHQFNTSHRSVIGSQTDQFGAVDPNFNNVRETTVKYPNEISSPNIFDKNSENGMLSIDELTSLLYNTKERNRNQSLPILTPSPPRFNNERRRKTLEIKTKFHLESTGIVTRPTNARKAKIDNPISLNVETIPVGTNFRRHSRASEIPIENRLPYTKNKIIKDCIYNFIEVSPLCKVFMDTPHFQRLKRIRQLGLAHHVFPSMNHTRFEHSLGVMHLTGEVIKHFNNNQLPTESENDQMIFFSDEMTDLIKLGALLHDIGHMAYSHLFDDFLNERFRLEKQQFDLGNGDIQFDEAFTDHENRSVLILKQINDDLRHNHSVFALSAESIKIVSSVITGRVIEGYPPYIFEIVHNAINNIDTDKMDYLQRDSHHSGLSSFQPDYIILNMQIQNGHIVFNNRAKQEIRELFHTRNRMFEMVYHHKTTLKITDFYKCLITKLNPNVTMENFLMYDDYFLECELRRVFSNAFLLFDLRQFELCNCCDHNFSQVNQQTFEKMESKITFV